MMIPKLVLLVSIIISVIMISSEIQPLFVQPAYADNIVAVAVGGSKTFTFNEGSSVIVNYKLVATAAVNGDNINGCNGQATITFASNASGVTIFPNPLVIGTCSSNAVYPVTYSSSTPGTYQITVVNVNGAGGYQTDSAVIILNVLAVAKVNLDVANPTAAYWNEPFTISGTYQTNNNLDTIAVIWKDGGTPEPATIDSVLKTWSASHTYQADEVGSKTITVNLISAIDSSVRATTSTPFTVKIHPTSITIETIASLPWGQPITVNGKLNDDTAFDDDAKIAGLDISVTGDIVPEKTVQTVSGGGFSASGNAVGFPSKTTNEINAEFSGTTAYGAATKVPKTYETTIHPTTLTIRASTQQDNDGDGTANECDSTPNGIAPPVGDLDDDGIIDGIDNSPNNYNPDQSDNDSDLTGNPSDSTPNGVVPPVGDLDDDGVTNSLDSCTNNYNPTIPIAWQGAIGAVGKLVDEVTVGGIGSAPLTFQSQDTNVLPSSPAGSLVNTNTIGDGTYSTTGTAAGSLPQISGLSFKAVYAGEPGKYSPIDATSNYKTRKHITALGLDSIPVLYVGTKFNAKGSSLTDSDFGNIGISGKLITFEGSGVGSPALASATTGGMTFTGITTSPTIVSSTEGYLLRLNSGATIIPPSDTSMVQFEISGMGSDPFLFTGTNIDGSQCTVSGYGADPDIISPPLDCDKPMTQIVVTSAGSLGYVSIKSIKTIKPNTLPTELLSADFNDETIGTFSQVTVEEGAYHSTATPLNEPNNNYAVQAHFAGDPAYEAADSNQILYDIANTFGVGGSEGSTENVLRYFTGRDCASGSDSDSDKLCNLWETNGIDYIAGGQTYYLFLPGASSSKKDIYVELDAMTGHAPSMAANGPIDNVTKAFGKAPVSNGLSSTGIILHVTADETALTHALVTSIWANTNTVDYDDHATIKGRHFGNATQHPTLGGTTSDLMVTSGSLSSHSSSFSGITISPPPPALSGATPNTEGTIYFREKLTLGTSGCTIGAATASASFAVSPQTSSLTFSSPTVEVKNDPVDATGISKIAIIKLPFNMASNIAAASYTTPTITTTLPIVDNPDVSGACSATTLVLALSGIPPTVSTTLLDAKAQAYHYALFAHGIQSCSSGSPSGVAEPGGNDLVVSLGCDWGISSGATESGVTEVSGHTATVGTGQQQAGTFMHELGHNLGLGHGGPVAQTGSGDNCKPLYTSVMSYSRQMPTYFANAGDATGWQLNYSRGLFASPAPDLDEAKNFEPYGLRAKVNFGSEIPKIVYGTPRLSQPVRIATPSLSLAAFPSNIDWNQNGRFESMGGTYTFTVVDGAIGPSGDTASLTLNAGTLTNSATTQSGTVNMSAYIKFSADPGLITASVSASSANGFIIASSGTSPPPPKVWISGVGNVRLVGVNIPFTRDTASSASAFPDVTVTLSGATASATFAAGDVTKGPSEIDNGSIGPGTSATTHTVKVSGLSFSSSSAALSSSVFVRAKIFVTFDTAIGIPKSSVSVVNTGSSISGGSYGALAVESVTTKNFVTGSTLALQTQHIITINQTVNLPPGAASSGVPTFTVTINHPSAKLTRVEPYQSSPGITATDLNNFGTIGCTASTDSTPSFSDYNDWLGLNYDVSGVAGGLLSNGNSPQDITSQEELLQQAGQNTFHIRDPLVEGATNIQQAGQKVSVKFQLLTPTVPAQIINNAQVTLLAAPLNVACDQQGTSIPSAPLVVGPFSFNALTKQYIKDWQTPKTANKKWAILAVKDYNTPRPEILTIYNFQEKYKTTNNEYYSIDVCFK